VTAALFYRLAEFQDRILGGDPIEPMVVDVPDEFDAARPVDLDACSSCGGDGLVAVIDWMVTGLPVDVTCPRCGGTGEERAA
jgi:hypothetical protein